MRAASSLPPCGIIERSMRTWQHRKGNLRAQAWIFLVFVCIAGLHVESFSTTLHQHMYFCMFLCRSFFQHIVHDVGVLILLLLEGSVDPVKLPGCPRQRFYRKLEYFPSGRLKTHRKVQTKGTLEFSLRGSAMLFSKALVCAAQGYAADGATLRLYSQGCTAEATQARILSISLFGSRA